MAALSKFFSEKMLPSFLERYGLTENYKGIVFA